MLCRGSEPAGTLVKPFTESGPAVDGDLGAQAIVAEPWPLQRQICLAIRT
jgi:hypothetical protein